MKTHLRTILFMSFLCVTAISFLSCGLARSSHLYKSYKYDNEMECYIGETMIMEESGIKNDVYKIVYPGGIRWELVYSGKVGNNIKIYYREYVATNEGWMAKDAFTQELDYDLTENTTIRYKQLLLEIISADNQKIVYKVLSSKVKSSNQN